MIECITFSLYPGRRSDLLLTRSTIKSTDGLNGFFWLGISQTAMCIKYRPMILAESKTSSLEVGKLAHKFVQLLKVMFCPIVISATINKRRSMVTDLSGQDT